MNNIERAIVDSRKLEITLPDNKAVTIHPYFILKKTTGTPGKILRGYIEGSNNSCDVSLEDIKSTKVLPQQYAIDDSCLHFNFRDYEIIFPTKRDLRNP